MAWSAEAWRLGAGAGAGVVVRVPVCGCGGRCAGVATTQLRVVVTCAWVGGGTHPDNPSFRVARTVRATQAQPRHKNIALSAVDIMPYPQPSVADS